MLKKLACRNNSNNKSNIKSSYCEKGTEATSTSINFKVLIFDLQSRLCI